MKQSELLANLVSEGVLDPDVRDRIVEQNRQPAESDPIGIKILAGIGGWFAALFLLPFIGMIADSMNSGIGWLVSGIVLLVLAILLRRKTQSTFPGQLALAFALAGHLAAVGGLVEGLSNRYEWVSAILAHAVVMGAVYPFFNSGIYRFIGALALGIMVTLWVIVELDAFPLIHALIAIETLTIGILMQERSRHPSLNPLFVAAVCMLPATLVFMDVTQMDSWWHSSFRGAIWPSSLIVAAGLVTLFVRIAGGWGSLRRPWLLAVVLAVILLGLFTTPGILVAIGLLVIGFADQDRLVSAIAFVFLPVFLVFYYYTLHVDLAYKSAVVTASGILLLALRWGLRQLQPAEGAS